MSIYQIDRVQYIESEDTIMIFEFFLVNDLDKFIVHFEENSKSFKESYIEKNYLKKLKFLWDLSVRNKTHLLIIIYDSRANKFAFIERIVGKEGCTWDVMDFSRFQKKFININNINGQGSKSKVLGAIKEENQDSFTLNILKTIGSYIDENDDNGITVTKKLLDGLTTKGFDFDLFQYLDSTGETIIYEFLKNETSYITNYTANPMRYCWTGEKNDNKQKFISLWNAKEVLNGRLYLINYSDNVKEGIGISEILELDVERGLLQENKYNLTYDEFIKWMIKMNNYTDQSRDYLNDYNEKRMYYDENFFKNWSAEKKNYGKTK